MSKLLWGGLMIFYLTMPACASDNYKLKTFGKRFQAVTSDSEYVALCREFITKAEDIDVIREAQIYWDQLDPDGVLEFTRGLAASDPSSTLYKYLLGRITKDNIEQIMIGRELIASDPSFPNGYRLVLGTYDAVLLNGDPNSPEAIRLSEEFPKDSSLFNALAKLVPDHEWPLKFLYDYQIYTRLFDEALETLKKASSMKAGWAGQFEFAILSARMGYYPLALNQVTKEIDRRIKEGDWDAKWRDGYIDQYYRDALSSAMAYEELINYLTHKPEDQKDSGIVYDLACFHAKTGNRDSALFYLNMAAEMGWDNAPWARDDSDLVSLHLDPHWDGIIAAMRANWDLGEETRRAAALKDKVDKEAFDWALPDESGNIVRLSDLKGKIVVLYFWATWCGFCQLAMPLVNDFANQHTGDDIQVFAIQVMEIGQGKARRYMQEKGYLPTLLFGNEDVKTKYGIEGIPFICVIDKTGRIRYEQLGYNEDIANRLEYWVEDLQ